MLILDKSVILRLPFCVSVGYSVLTYVNDSLTYWLPDRIKTINWIWKAFSWLGMLSTTGNTQKIFKILQIFVIYPFSIESSQVLNMWMTFSSPKTNCTKFTHHRLKIRKVIELIFLLSVLDTTSPLTLKALVLLVSVKHWGRVFSSPSL